MPEIQRFGNGRVERLKSRRSIEGRGGPCATERLAMGSAQGFYGYLGGGLGRLNEAIADADKAVAARGSQIPSDGPIRQFNSSRLAIGVAVGKRLRSTQCALLGVAHSMERQ
jgi:hypothetical protein